MARALSRRFSQLLLPDAEVPASLKVTKLLYLVERVEHPEAASWKNYFVSPKRNGKSDVQYAFRSAYMASSLSLDVECAAIPR